MTCGTIFTQIKIEVIVFFLQPKLFHTSFQLTIVILSLASTDNLTNSRNQAVHSCNGLAILVCFHIECFNFLWIVCNKNRFLKNLFCQITLMLCLQITSPGYFIIKLVIILLEKLNCFCIGNTTELRVCHMIQSVKKSFVHKRIEEVHFLWSILKNISDHIFQHRFCKIHVIFKISKCTLRLDHPELSCMTCGVGVLSTESWSKCIYITECLCKCLTVQLTAYSQICLLAKEILRVINISLIICRNVIQIHGCNLEHLPCTLAVTSCDQRSVYINKSSLLKEFVYCICTERTYTENSLEGICSGTKMCDRS